MNTSRVVFEPSGQVRDLSGRRIGTHDAEADARQLRALYKYVGDVSRSTRLLAQPQGELGQPDVQTQGTAATSIAQALDTVADVVCPVTLVQKTSGTWLAQDVSLDLAAPAIPQIASTGTPAELDPKLTSKTYDATGSYALSAKLSVDTIENADLDLIKLTLRRLVNAIKLDREIRIANLLTTSTSFATANRTAAAVKWNGTSPTPLVDVFAALLTSITPPTHLVMTEPAAQWFYGNATIYQYLAAGGPMPRVVVAKARKLTSAVAAYVWGAPTSANATLVSAPMDPEAVSTARTFRYVGDAPDKEAAEESNGYLLRSFVDAKAGARGSRHLVLTVNDADVMLSGQLGGIITGVLA